MNVVYMHTHDSGRHFSPYGYNAPTPNLMRLARRSTLFRHCYNAGPTCSPSRAALTTGTYPHCNGMIGLAHRGFKLDDANMHIASYLKTQNYATALFGVQHEGADPYALGYETATDLRGESANVDMPNALAAAEYIRNYDGDKPFFLSFGMFNTHRVYPEISPDIDPAYLLPPSTIYDNDNNRRDYAGYLTSAKMADDCAGVVIAAMQAAGRDRDTVLVFTTDHGLAFPHMKCSLFDTGIGVALMIQSPGGKTAGRALDSLVSHIDVFPTLCDLCGVDKPGWLQGVSIRPLIDGETEAVRDRIFSEVTYHASYEPMRCVRTDRYKFIRRYDYHNGVVPANLDDGPSKQFLMEHGLMERTRDRDALYDLYHDPAERTNLANDSRYRGAYDELSLSLNNWMLETGDPLVHTLHRVPKPAGAFANRLSSLQPGLKEYEE